MPPVVSRLSVGLVYQPSSQTGILVRLRPMANTRYSAKAAALAVRQMPRPGVEGLSVARGRRPQSAHEFHSSRTAIPPGST